MTRTNHIAVLNREMGEVKTEVTSINRTLAQLSSKVDKLDSRTGWILGLTAVSILAQILIQVWR